MNIRKIHKSGYIRLGKLRKRKKSNTRKSMKKEYDFTKGVRGKFYRPGVKMNLPIYLDEDNYSFMEKIAQKKKTDISKAVNELIRVDKKLAKAIS
jgi:hypothetical protein